MKRPLLDDEQDATLIPIISSAEDSVKQEEEKIRPFILNPMDEVEDEDDEYEPSGLGKKKRRLSVEQVKALERNFESENKLDPERKVRLAQELGLQPRQVAVWFQNRRARWKAKQMERDYGALKSQYDHLKIDCDSLRRDKEALLAQIKELKAKVADTRPVASLLMESSMTGVEEEKPALIYRDGASDSDSSGVFNEDQHCGGLVDFRAYCSTFLFDDLNDKSKEDKYLDEELCSGLFSEDQPTGLSWYCSMQGWD